MMDLEDGEYWKSLINMSLTKFLILQTLHQEPCHGYAILDRLKQFTQSCCIPTYGGIYPVLKQLVQGEYAGVTEETGGGRKRQVYALTEKGERAYRTATEAWRAVVPLLVQIVGETTP